MKNLTCAFTGHRPQNLPFGFNEADERCVFLKEQLERKITDLVINKHVTNFITGMALGVDMYAAEIVLKLKEIYPTITLECAIPCELQPAKWPEGFRNRYFEIAAKCDKETMLQTKYTSDCMQKRNKYLVDSCDILLAIWDGKKSGTGNTVSYAKEMGKEVLVLNPNDIEIGFF